MTDTKVRFANGCSVTTFYHIGCPYFEEWQDKEGRIHRPNGLPAVLDDEGYESYYEHGQLLKIKDNEQKNHYKKTS